LRRSAASSTYDELNELNVLPSEEVTSEQIEDIMSMLSDMGINVVEEDEAEDKEAEDTTERQRRRRTRPRRSAVAATKKKEPTDRTDDPVRMYLREMGSVELLSREGEIAIAKRIEAGRETMIAGLCESPLTFQAIIIWREELNEGKIASARHHRPRGHLCRSRGQGCAASSEPGKDRGRPQGGRGKGKGGGEMARRPASDDVTMSAASQNFEDDDEDDDENNLSLAAMEAS
jgi:RNA polymerase primary sigma factor